MSIEKMKWAFIIIAFIANTWTVNSIATQEPYMKYKDKDQPVEVRVTDLLNRMTLQEKIGQMTQIDYGVGSFDVVKNYYIGSVLSGGDTAPLPRATAEDWIGFINRYQEGALSTRLAIPMVYGIDAVHGHSNVFQATVFPHNIGLGAARDVDLVRRIGSATAVEVRATGIRYAFAPCIAVCRDPRWGRCYESYSEDPEIVREMTDIIYGLQGEDPNGPLNGLPYVEKRYFQFVLAVPRGFIISDWEGIDQITTPAHGNYTYSVLASIRAGIDMVMVPRNYTEFIDILTSLVENKYIRMERINDAVRRILRVKFIMGLFENPMADTSRVNELGSQAHRKLAREAVRKTLVLLKNGKEGDGPILPLLKGSSKILVAGTHAHNLGYQCGGWTINWQGFHGNNDTKGTTILDAVKSMVDPTTEVIFNENPDQEFIKSNKFTHAIVVIGETPYAETEGDSKTLTMIEPGPNVINNVCGALKCVVVVISGRPIVIEPYMGSIDALVAAWLPGTEGRGVTDVLFGDYDFTGKLPRTWFRNVSQLPMNFGDKDYDPLFPFGFGMSMNQISSKPTTSSVHIE